MCRKQRKSPYQSDIGKDHQNLSLVEPTANATKHNSKGNGGTVALAAVHAESKRKRGERNLRRSSSVWKNLKFNFLKRSDPEMINKYDAASKIQRAWRNRVQFGACADEEQSNPAFEPNRLSVRNPPERRSTNIAVLGTLSQAPVGRMNSAETIIPTKSRSRFQSKAGKEHGESQYNTNKNHDSTAFANKEASICQTFFDCGSKHDSSHTLSV
ncbi:unnamed protein product [Pseudo-nitzschia multistriata]|uniref:Uncharacterized protein n=1 Tax=Pseudo-nitzschia multistriata TaxID=183589 RepID=A0A448ZTA2_9STRA|nr:unnamed protein product [Pseudo-nitzschia multistriata]